MSFSPNLSPLHHSAVGPFPSTVSATATTVFQRPSDDTESPLLKRKRSVEPETAQELPSLAQGNITMGALAKDAASATGLVDAKVPQGSKDESGPPSQSDAGLFNQVSFFPFRRLVSVGVMSQLKDHVEGDRV